ncbi:hypothetical protein ACOMHN_003552 [Nucella lapillus]
MLRGPGCWLLLLMVMMVLMVLGTAEDLPNTAGRKGARSREGVRGTTPWWALASLGRERTNNLRTSITQLYANPRLLPLTRRQRKLNARNPGSLLAVARGALMAIDECQFQFRNSRWNCPIAGDGSSFVFDRMLQRGESGAALD